MKKIISKILVFIMIISSIPFVSFDTLASMPKADAMDGYQNLSLAYTFMYNGEDCGRQTVNDFLPLTGYKDKQGKIVDYFFDSFLFLPCNGVGPSGARMHSKEGEPTLEIDWKTYVEDTFYKGKNVDALDSAFGKTKQALNDSSDKKAGVFFTILHPNVAATNFGELGGRNLNFSKSADRKYAVKWIIDEQIRLFNERGYKNLDLVGFYWLEEYLDIRSDYAIYKYASDYLHSLGLKFIWIPFYKANGYNQWQNVGFDVVCMQPNNYWEEESISDRVQTCANYCSRYGMGMELEVDSRAYKSEEYFKRYLQYLEVGMNSGAMNSIKMYYHDAAPGAYSFMGDSKDEIPRYLYDVTYKYAKGTLTAADLKYDMADSISFKLPEDVNWVSYNKNYEATKPYVTDGSVDYQNVNGRELTDGVIGISDLGTEWHPFYATYTDGQGNMGATIDLGGSYGYLTHFVVHFSNIQNYGIGVPTNVRLYISNDGVDFELLANPVIQKAGIAAYISYVSHEYITARYVKVLFNRSSTGPFVFCSEFLVGEGTPKPFDPYDPPQNPSEEDPEAPSEHVHKGNSVWYNDNDYHWNVCECGQYINESAHDKGKWVVVKNATVDEDGEKQRCCTVCGYVIETQKIPKTGYKIADVNMNNKVDSMDYTLIKRAYFGTFNLSETQMIIADVNQNQKLDSMDYILVRRIYFGTYVA